MAAPSLAFGRSHESNGAPVTALDHDGPAVTAAVDDLEQVGRAIEQLLDRVAATAPEAAAAAESAIGEITALYGEGLRRVTDVLGRRDDGPALLATLAGDDLVAGLLLLHGLHPVPLRERVSDAVRFFTREAPGDVRAAVVDVAPERVAVRITGDTSADPGPHVLRLRLESLVRVAAPDVPTIDVEVPVDQVLIPVSAIGVRRAGAAGGS